MSNEGYVSAQATRIAEIMARHEKARVAVEVAKRLVKEHCYYNSEEDGYPLQTPEAFWDSTAPSDLIPQR